MGAEWQCGRLGSFGMEEIRLSSALAFLKAPHPAWKQNPEWPEEVGFATWESTDFYGFIDPLVRDDPNVAAWERFDRAVAESGRPSAVLLTAPWQSAAPDALQRDTTRARGYTRMGAARRRPARTGSADYARVLCWSSRRARAVSQLLAPLAMRLRACVAQSMYSRS